MGSDSSAILVPLTVTFVALVATLAVLVLWKRRTLQNSLHGTKTVVNEYGQPVRRSTRCVGCQHGTHPETTSTFLRAFEVNPLLASTSWEWRNPRERRACQTTCGDIRREHKAVNRWSPQDMGSPTGQPRLVSPSLREVRDRPRASRSCDMAHGSHTQLFSNPAQLCLLKLMTWFTTSSRLYRGQASPQLELYR